MTILSKLKINLGMLITWVALTFATADEFKVNTVAGDSMTISYGDVNIVSALQCYFADKNWKIIYTVPGRESGTVKNGIFSIQTKKNILKIGTYDFKITNSGEQCIITFSYDLPANSESIYAVFDIFLNKEFFNYSANKGLKLNHYRKGKDFEFDTIVGKFRFKVLSPKPFQFRNTEGRRCWGNALRFRSLLNVATRIAGKTLKRTIRIQLSHMGNENPVLIKEYLAQKRKNSKIERNGHDDIIIPRPVAVKKLKGNFIIDKDTVIFVPKDKNPSDFTGLKILQEELKEYFGMTVPIVRSMTNIPADKKIIFAGLAKNIYSTTWGKKLISYKNSIAKICTKPEGYVLLISPEMVVSIGGGVRGRFYGIQSLLQLLKRSDTGNVSVKCQKIVDYPKMKIRGMMLSPGYCSLDKFKKVLKRVVARHKFNTLIIGAGSIGHIKWKSHPKLGVPGLSWSTEQLREAIKYAKELYLDVIPEIEAIGHQERLRTVYPHLSENGLKGNAICLSNDEAWKVLKDIYLEAIEIYKPKFVHIGAHEANPIAYCPKCKNKSAAKLFSNHITKVYKFLKKHNIKTMMNSDMLLDYKIWKDKTPATSNVGNGVFDAVIHPAIEDLPRDIIISVWDYEDKTHFNALQYFKDKGFSTIAYTWYGDKNNYYFAQEAVKQKSLGLVGTTWSFFSAGNANAGGNVNMMSILSAEYSWSSDKPALKDLPYSPRRRLQYLLSSPRESLKAKRLITVDITKISNLDYSKIISQNLSAHEKSILNALRLVPSGKVKMGNIPFNITMGKCVAVGGENMKRLKIPESISIAIERKVISLAFLHGASFLGFGKTLGGYTIVYEDGTRAISIKLREMNNISPFIMPVSLGQSFTDKWYASSFLANSEQVWQGMTKSGNVLDLQLFEWTNPYPKKIIKEIIFTCEKNNPNGILFLLGITINPSKQ